METPEDDPKYAGTARKVAVAYTIRMAIFAATLFLTAGTLNWPAAWAFLALYNLIGIPVTVALARHAPAVLKARMKPPIQPGQPLWDKVLLLALMIYLLAWLLVPGLDAMRFGWSHVPLWLQVIGGVLMLVAIYVQYLTLRENAFMEASVRVQKDRGQAVITTGPYAVVRHPFYAAIIPFFPAMGLVLGSWWAVILSAPIAIILAYRSVREERVLAAELEGYADYMTKVRYRLIPQIW